MRLDLSSWIRQNFAVADSNPQLCDLTGRERLMLQGSDKLYPTPQPLEKLCTESQVRTPGSFLRTTESLLEWMMQTNKKPKKLPPYPQLQDLTERN